MRDRSLNTTTSTHNPNLITIPSPHLLPIPTDININSITITIIITACITVVIHLCIDSKLIIMAIYGCLFTLPSWRLTVLREEAWHFVFRLFIIMFMYFYIFEFTDFSYYYNFGYVTICELFLIFPPYA